MKRIEAQSSDPFHFTTCAVSDIKKLSRSDIGENIKITVA